MIVLPAAVVDHGYHADPESFRGIIPEVAVFAEGGGAKLCGGGSFFVSVPHFILY